MVLSSAGFADAELRVGDFSAGDLDGWKSKKFAGKTDYQLVLVDNKSVLRATSNSSASGMVREITVDLDKTPILHWSWRVSHTLGELDEPSRGGDDYAARIYVVVSGGLAFWNTKSLNYVWASKMPLQSNWPNAFAGANVVMIAQQSGESIAGQWVEEQRNVKADLKRFFGNDINKVDAVAIMTDTDNAGGSVQSEYGDIYFTAQ